MSLDVAVVGAGIAGLAAARSLAAQGHTVAVFDRGRAVGGRLSTRRTAFGAFDHGSQFATVRDPIFSQYVAQLQSQGAIEVWDHIKEGAVIGKPGMAMLVKAGFAGQDAISVTSRFDVAHIGKVAEGYVLSNDDGDHQGPFDRVVVTVPAPQALHLLQAFGEPFDRLAEAQFAPCYTLLAAFDDKLKMPDVPVLREGSALASACRQSARASGRETQHDLWVVQAGALYSAAHIERDRELMVPLLLRLFQDEIGVDVPQPVYAVGHRWRYALVERPVGKPFLISADGTLAAAGDGLLGPRVELAFLSGAQAGQALAAE